MYETLLMQACFWVYLLPSSAYQMQIKFTKDKSWKQKYRNSEIVFFML